MSPYRLIAKWITPPEARDASNEVLATADEVKALANQVKGVGNQLNGTWTGGAKQRFFSHYESLPSELERFARSLEARAAQIAVISVKIMIEEWFEDLTGRNK
jgi:WXG100 family type VII secretion target